MTNTLSGLKIAILATDNFEEAELLEPKKALEQAGAQTVVIAPHEGTIEAMRHDTKTGKKIIVDMVLGDANPMDFDGVLIPGGALNADKLRADMDAQEFITTIDEDEKPIAVICHGPWLLISSGIIDGRTLTSYHTIQDDIRNAGGEWEDAEVVRDDNWVSSRQPSDIPEFNKAMIELFSESLHIPQTPPLASQNN